MGEINLGSMVNASFKRLTGFQTVTITPNRSAIAPSGRSLSWFGGPPIQ